MDSRNHLIHFFFACKVLVVWCWQDFFGGGCEDDDESSEEEECHMLSHFGNRKPWSYYLCIFGYPIVFISAYRSQPYQILVGSILQSSSALRQWRWWSFGGLADGRPTNLGVHLSSHFISTKQNPTLFFFGALVWDHSIFPSRFICV